MRWIASPSDSMSIYTWRPLDMYFMCSKGLLIHIFTSVYQVGNHNNIHLLSLIFQVSNPIHAEYSKLWLAKLRPESRVTVLYQVLDIELILCGSLMNEILHNVDSIFTEFIFRIIFYGLLFDILGDIHYWVSTPPLCIWVGMIKVPYHTIGCVHNQPAYNALFSIAFSLKRLNNDYGFHTLKNFK